MATAMATSVVHDELFGGVADADVALRVARALGPAGSGFLLVTGCPGLRPLRDRLLAEAASAARLPDKELRAFRRQHVLGTDIPSRGVPPQQRRVTTFATQVELSENGGAHATQASSDLSVDMEAVTKLIADTGLRLLQTCDTIIGNVDGRLAAAICNGGTAKTRLINYHRRWRPKKPQKAAQDAGLWQEWHYDYGLLTGILAPTYRFEGGQVESSVIGAGLLIRDRNKEDLISVEPIADDTLIFQVGEAAQILSGGALRATVHCVARAPGGVPPEADPSRQTCVVFLQPHWSRTLEPPDGVPVERVLQDGTMQAACVAGSGSPACVRPEDVPPLGARWTPGQTFGDFSKATIQQYYAHKDQHSA